MYKGLHHPETNAVGKALGDLRRSQPLLDRVLLWGKAGQTETVLG